MFWNEEFVVVENFVIGTWENFHRALSHINPLKKNLINNYKVQQLYYLEHFTMFLIRFFSFNKYHSAKFFN